jgi:hypothetical protein
MSNTPEDEPEKRAPKPKPEADRSSGDGRFPPRRTAVGTFDSGSPGYSPGQLLKCLIADARQGGYDVLIIEDGVRAFLKTDRSHQAGTVIFGRFQYYQDRN